MHRNEVDFSRMAEKDRTDVIESALRLDILNGKKKYSEALKEQFKRQGVRFED